MISLLILYAVSDNECLNGFQVAICNCVIIFKNWSCSKCVLGECYDYGDDYAFKAPSYVGLIFYRSQ